MSRNISGQKGQPERPKSFQTIMKSVADVFLPLLLYYLISSVLLYLMNDLVQYVAQKSSAGGLIWVLRNADVIRATNNGIAMLIAIFCLRRYFLSEVCMDGQPVLIKPRRLAAGWLKEECRSLSSKWRGMIAVVIMATASSICLNLLAGLIQAAQYSQTYQEVAKIQYAVPFILGLLLYGVISPLAEEILFRGIVYRKCRRYLGVLPGILLSSLLFAILHGNLVQGVYAFLMGMLMSGVYERYQNFFAPLLFHATANIATFSVSYFDIWKTCSAVIMNCVIFAIISAASLVFVFYKKKS